MASETESVCSPSVKTEEVVDAVKRIWPSIRIEADIPGWFIIMAAMIIGLRNTCQS